MFTRKLLKKAPWIGAFFLFIPCQPLNASTCKAPYKTEPVKVRYAHDGDTITLSDDRRVRLIGINTPEVARGENPTQPGALQARNRLRQLLFQSGNRAILVEGRQKRDRHGRTLANLWLPDGTNVTATLLQEGLGWSVAIPPNITFLDCYQSAEEAAREAKKGVWKRQEYEAVASEDLSLRNSRGFMRVTGRIVRVGKGGGARWINLEGKFAIRIPDSDLEWFKQVPGRSWIGKTLEVRGWVYSTKGELRITAHHPSALQLQ